jgi:nitric oxide dioxygenase
MNDRQIILVKESWLVLERQEDFVEVFYDTLFSIKPELRRLFKRNIHMQGRKILSMLGYSIEHLNDFEKVVPALISSGIRHIDYGVEILDFAVFREALLKTLQHYLKDDYSDEIKTAWNNAYNLIESIMCSTMKYSVAG